MADSMNTTAGFIATASIKLVVWDMDDTFWDGTLSEGDITLIDRNIGIIKALTDRGIMSSIASKNEFGSVEKVLSDAGIWDYFIFPQISWNSKGGSIAAILEQANLRQDNVLFIDDNPINIEEIRFLFPKMMVAFPQDVLPVLLDIDEAKGKDDRRHSRLKQYKQLEIKTADQTQSSLSNEDFLRQCDIKLRFEFNMEQHFDRIIELINRSNQLNFTKIRLESDGAIAEFKKLLERHDVFSAAIFARDRYGDHGLIGFYMQLKNERVNKLLHYVWSCRMMNSGLEQYVYEYLGNPTIEVVGPVSNPIKVFEKIDWIKETQAGERGDASDTDPRVLLIGSCDLTAVASYCSRNRVEYVNGVKNGVMIRYDDFGFILGNAADVEASKALENIPCWSKSDFVSFRKDLSKSEVLIISLSAAMKGAYLLTEDGVAIRVHPEGLGAYIDIRPWEDFLRNCKFYSLNFEQRVDLLKRALDFTQASASSAKHRFLIGANTRDVGGHLSKANQDLMAVYNSACEEFCRENTDWQFVSIDEVVGIEKLVDDRHYTRIGYFDIASYINEKIRSKEVGEGIKAAPAPNDAGLAGVIRSGRELSRLNLFGAQRGATSHIKRIIKLTPLAGVLRKTFVKSKKDPLLA